MHINKTRFNPLRPQLEVFMAPFVSIIVVNYNGRDLLSECLQSVKEQNYPRYRFEVIVVDNASTDDSLESLHQEFPWVRVLPLSKNHGFSGGNNAGFGVARGEWLALINSDASAEPNWIKESVEAGMAAEDIGGVAGHLVFRDNVEIINSTGLELYRDGRAGDRDLRQDDRQLKRPPGEVFGGCGAALLLRRTMIEQLNGFDDALFMYYEDLDLAWRARRAGWRFVYSSEARVRHAVGGTIGLASPMQMRYVERNRTIVNLRHAPQWLAVGTGLGLIARFWRSIARWAIGGESSFRHVLGLATAITNVAARLPSIVVQRLMSVEGDRTYRQWSRPSPR
jgi:GT2 family glycosyltransferase